MGLYLDEPDLEALAADCLTDGPDDKKIDFIHLNRETKKIAFAQGYYGEGKKDSAPANKASDLNTAAAWLISGPINEVPVSLRAVLSECREALQEGEVETIDLLYVHNRPESVNVNKELQTAAAHVANALGRETQIGVASRELGFSAIGHLFATQKSHIDIKDPILCPAPVLFRETGPKWRALVLSVPGAWLHGLFTKYGDSLFSANYRGFLGITKRRRINTGIRRSAESKPADFWVFNNGITLLTLGSKETKEGLNLTGISIINGAQTTGSLGSVDQKQHSLDDVRVLCRVIESNDAETISEIVKFNNTQNEITTWDQYSNDPEQTRIAQEFSDLGHVYSVKRGFKQRGEQLGIEEVAQPLTAFRGRWQDANRGKNEIFDRKPLYNHAFEGKKARHILFVYTLARAIDERRIELKQKSSAGRTIDIEDAQLGLLRNLRFKQFLIAVVARVLDTVIGKKINADAVAFTLQAADSKNHSLEALIALWLPVIEAVLSYVSTQTTADAFGASSRDEAFLGSIAKHVGAMLYAAKAPIQYAQFADVVAES